MLAGMSAGENVHDCVEESSAVNSTFSLEELSTLQQSCGTFSMRDDDSSKRVDVEDLSGADEVVAAFQSFCIDNSSLMRDQEAKDTAKVDYSAESSVLRNDEREDALNANFPLDSYPIGDERKAITRVDDNSNTCPDITCSSPCRRSSRRNRLDQENKKKGPERDCRKTSSKSAFLDVSSVQLTRRRRSSLSKQARATVWGLLGNMSVLEQNGAVDISPQKAKKSRRLKGVGANGKREKNKKARDSTKLKGKRFNPTGPITLKVKFGSREAASLVNASTVMDDNKEQDSRQESFPEVSIDVQDLMKKEADGSMSFQSCDGTLDKASDIHVAIEDITENAGGNAYGDLCESPFHAEVGKVVATIDNRISDSGTSPDSEVINLTPDAQISEKDPDALHHTVSSINAYLASENMSNSSLLCKDADEGKRENDPQTSNFSVNVEAPGPENLVDDQEFSKLGQKEKVGDVFYHSDASTSTTTENAYLNTFEVDGLPKEPPCSKVTDFAISSETNKVESAIQANLSPRLGTEIGPVESSKSKKLLPCTNGKKVARSSRARKETRTKREKTSKTKGSQEKSSAKQKGKDKGLKGDSAQTLHEVENHCETEAGETGIGNKSLTEDTPPKDMAPVMVAQECIPITQAWVCCDGCNKWRRIPAALADIIRENDCKWYCKDNMDKDFADCSIPQEKSNADINAELQISDASCEEDADSDARLDSIKSTQKQRKVTQQPSWTHIKSNSFLHRRRKTQAIDEIMVCHCKPPSEGRVGCGDGCLNRMLNIECIQGTCPSGEFCSNQQFQKRKYAKLKAIKCGKKGYGLQLLEEVSEGQFLIEYVGEVLDMHAYEARQREYAVKGHRHFYFMTLNGSEVIDACAKGNLGRFINHSCEPNCRTEKWMVNGEVCIGIFALRDIKKGEEVTFDYNYVRVFGAAAKKCVCGSSQCRGYIGGDPLNAEIVVQDDSDDEYPEPIMARGDGIALTSSHTEEEKQIREMSNQAKIDIDCSSTAAGCLENTKENGDTKLSASTALSVAISLEKESSVGQHSPVQLVGTSSESGGITGGNISAAPEECFARETSVGNPLCSNQGSDANSLSLASGKIDPVKKVKNDVGEVGVVLSKSRARIKTSKNLSSVKKRKPKAEALDGKKPMEFDTKVHLPPFRSKQLLEDLSNGRFEAVQEKLNELLDNDGGISKRKDASRGYLKLLLLTAASGDSGNGEAIQSNRDLSMILDALLKTKSRTVLVDIINKNGLQMLHNIMKRCRKQFIKIPILRKLLKVLEYLATREILTSEHINGGPRYPGVESFRDSILSLTEHTDKQVHQIARSFRDRWIPRSSRKFGCVHRDDCWIELHCSSTRDTISASHANSNDCAGVPLETFDGAAKPVLASSSVDAQVPDVSSGSRSTRKRKSRWDQPFKGSPDLGADTSMAGDGANNMEEDVPPGFSFPLNRPMLPSDAYLNDIDHKEGRPSYAKRSYGVAMGHSQPRFISRLSVAYGIPISIVQQFGSSEAETSENWIVAPGMPFQPFPPLPPYPRDKNKHSMSQASQKAGQDSHNRATHSSQNPPSTSGATETGMQTVTQTDFRRVRGPHNLSRTYFRQEKWNSSTPGGSQIQKRNVWGSMGNNSRNGTCQASPRSIHNEFNSSHCSEDISTGMQSGVKFHQHPW
ncbi:uncharacterized protein [Coffea arabica]|uniref:Uncharacterized protein isoform X1 n=1 Tax=Coffea arabica TaxID=13443 RepID=A0A6P6UUN1_COFAR|nr:histone-lysine N-methyltransferase ASHH2-like [Coffea arabica]